MHGSRARGPTGRGGVSRPSPQSQVGAARACPVGAQQESGHADAGLKSRQQIGGVQPKAADRRGSGPGQQRKGHRQSPPAVRQGDQARQRLAGAQHRFDQGSGEKPGCGGRWRRVPVRRLAVVGGEGNGRVKRLIGGAEKQLAVQGRDLEFDRQRIGLQAQQKLRQAGGETLGIASRQRPERAIVAADRGDCARQPLQFRVGDAVPGGAVTRQQFALVALLRPPFPDAALQGQAAGDQPETQADAQGDAGAQFHVPRGRAYSIRSSPAPAMKA